MVTYQLLAGASEPRGVLARRGLLAGGCGGSLPCRLATLCSASGGRDEVGRSGGCRGGTTSQEVVTEHASHRSKPDAWPRCLAHVMQQSQIQPNGINASRLLLGSRAKMTNATHATSHTTFSNALRACSTHATPPFFTGCIALLSHVRCYDEVAWSLKCLLHVTLFHFSEAPACCDFLAVQMASGRTLVFGGRGFVGAATGCKFLFVPLPRR